MPHVREASVFLEETDLSVEGGVAWSVEGRAQVLSWCTAATASGVPGKANKAQQQHPGFAL